MSLVDSGGHPEADGGHLLAGRRAEGQRGAQRRAPATLGPPMRGLGPPSPRGARAGGFCDGESGLSVISSGRRPESKSEPQRARRPVQGTSPPLENYRRMITGLALEGGTAGGMECPLEAARTALRAVPPRPPRVTTAHQVLPRVHLLKNTDGVQCLFGRLAPKASGARTSAVWLSLRPRLHKTGCPAAPPAPPQSPVSPRGPATQPASTPHRPGQEGGASQPWPFVRGPACRPSWSSACSRVREAQVWASREGSS